MSFIAKFFKSESQSGLENLNFFIFLVFVALIPLFFIPGGVVNFLMSKTLFIGLGTILLLLLCLIRIIKDGTIKIIIHPIIVAILGLLLVIFLASVLNETPLISMIGYNLEIGTFAFMAIMGVLFLIVAHMFQSQRRAFYLYGAFTVSLLLLAVFHTIRFIGGPEVLNFGVFPDLVSGPAGEWGNLAMIFGAGTILSLITLQMLSLPKLYKALTYLLLVISLIALAIVNFYIVWWILAIFSLVVFVYSYSFGTQKRKISISSFLVLIISIIFIVAGGLIGNFVADNLNINYISARPSWPVTFEIIQETVKTDPVLGVGPNNFSVQWEKMRPLNVNQSIFWNTTFNAGAGLIPSFVVTTGLLGILGWLVFFGLFLYIGIKTVFSIIEDVVLRYLTTSSFFVALFFWLSIILFSPGVPVIALTFIFSGLFVALAARSGKVSVIGMSLNKHPKVSFVTVLVIVFLIIGTLVSGFILTRKVIASYYVRQAFASQNFSESQDYLLKAISLEKRDDFFRILSDAYLVQLTSVVNQTDVSEDQVSQEFQSTLMAAVRSAEEARNINPHSFQNWMALAGVYHYVTPYVPGAYESAIEVYKEAEKRNPITPVIDLSRARLELANNNIEGARENIDKALQKKPNYSDAYFLISQIEASQGNLREAIKSSESAVLLSPNNPGRYFELGLLKYNAEDYSGAAKAFAKAVELAPNYLNAKYFLGLSYAYSGNDLLAIEQFEELQDVVPENQEVKSILSNLRAGNPPFNPPQEPETREELPVEEEQ